MMNHNDDLDDQFYSGYCSERTPGGVCFVLPNRRLGEIKRLGWLAFGFGIGAVVFLISWAMGWMMGGRALGGVFGGIMLVVGLTAFIPIRHAWKVVMGGFALMTDRTWSEIEIDNDGMRLRERFFRGSMTFDVTEDVRKVVALRVAKAKLASSQLDSVAAAKWLGTDGFAILADVEGKEQPKPIAICYPRSLLLKLAEELKHHLPSAIVDTTCETIEVGEKGPEATRAVPLDIVEQPASSDITVDHRHEGTAYRVPEAGLRSGSKGLLFFSIMWNGFMTLFTAAIIFAAFSEPSWQFLIFVVFLIPFWMVGAYCAYATIKMGKSKTAIVCAGEEIMVVTQSPFGQNTRQWHRNEIKHIRVGPSGTKINNVPVMELQFHTEDGKFGVLSERDNKELQWLAGQLMQCVAGGGRSLPDQEELVAG